MIDIYNFGIVQNYQITIISQDELVNIEFIGWAGGRWLSSDRELTSGFRLFFNMIDHFQHVFIYSQCVCIRRKNLALPVIINLPECCIHTIVMPYFQQGNLIKSINHFGVDFKYSLSDCFHQKNLLSFNGVLKNRFHPEKNLEDGQFMKTEAMENKHVFPIVI